MTPPPGFLDQQREQEIARWARAAARAAAAHASYPGRGFPLVQEGMSEAHDILARPLPPNSLALSRGRWHSLSGVGLLMTAGLVTSSIAAAKGYYLTPTYHVHDRRPSASLQGPDIVSRVAAIRELMQNEQIASARKVLGLIPVEAFDEPTMKRLRRALAPPVVRRSERRDVDRTQTYAWLRQHSHEFRGQWVAVDEDGLLAAAPTLKDLRRQLAALPSTQQPLIHKL